MIWYVAILNSLVAILGILRGLKRDDAAEVCASFFFVLAGVFAWIEAAS